MAKTATEKCDGPAMLEPYMWSHLVADGKTQEPRSTGPASSDATLTRKRREDGRLALSTLLRVWAAVAASRLSFGDSSLLDARRQTPTFGR